jgi:DNA-binding NarL/FixJ family response regulator
MAIGLMVVSATPLWAGLSVDLAGEPDVVLVGTAGSAAQARTLCATRDPDVVLIGPDLPDADPLALAAALRRAAPRRGVVLLGDEDDSRLLRALEARVSAYLPSTSPPGMVLGTVRHAAVAPGSFTAPNLARALRLAEHHLLSPREGEVLAHLRDGWSLSAIARALLVSDSTIRTYVSRVYDKLGVRDRAHALEVATRCGLLP